MNLVLKLAAFLVLTVFLMILLWKVPRLDLGAVIVITIVLAAWDFFWSPSGGPRG